MSRTDNTLDDIPIIKVTWKMNGHGGCTLIYLTKELLGDIQNRAVKDYALDEARANALEMWQRDKWKIRLWWPVRDWFNKRIRQVKYGRD